MKILVTGGAGFIGSNLVEKLLIRPETQTPSPYEIAIIDDFNDFYAPHIKRANIAALMKTAAAMDARGSSSASRLTVHEADIRDQNAVERIIGEGSFDTIIHLAARAGVRPSIQEPRLYIDTNITGTFNLLEAARKAGVRCFINGSSSSVYGVIKTTPFREDMCLSQTISPYAATKLACEQLCSNYSHLYKMRTLSLRFFTVYGPRQRPDLAIHKFTRAIHEGCPIDQYGDGSTRRDYTYVDDIVQGIEACLTYEGPLCDVFNLGESQTTTLSELIAAIETALGKKAVINYLPEQPGDVPVTYADISKARRELGYRPQTKIDTGIAKFVEWFLETYR